MAVFKNTENSRQDLPISQQYHLAEAKKYLSLARRSTALRAGTVRPRHVVGKPENLSAILSTNLMDRMGYHQYIFEAAFLTSDP
jgi:hypothetical protein